MGENSTTTPSIVNVTNPSALGIRMRSFRGPLQFTPAIDSSLKGLVLMSRNSSMRPPGKVLAQAGAALLCLSMATGCSTPGTDDSGQSTGIEATSSSSQPSATTTSGADSDTELHQVGDTVTMGDLKHTVHAVRYSAGDEIMSPESGTEWLVLDVEVTNNSSESQAISSLMMWTLNDPENRSVDVAMTGDERGNLDGELGAGRSMRGEIAYTVNPDHKQWELIFSPEVLGFGQAIYEIPAPAAAPKTPGSAQQTPSFPSVPDGSGNDKFTYDEAYAAWENGMPYFEAFCVNYIPTTDGGVSQCEGIQAGTVDAVTGEYLGG